MFENVFTRRRRALLAVCDGLLAATGHCRCAAHVSVPGPLGHGGVYDGLTSGEVDAAALAQIIVSHTEELGNVYVIDHTNIPRPRAKTSPGRRRLHTGGHRKGVHVTQAGWVMVTVTRVVRVEDSWSVPVLTRVIPPGEDIVAGTLQVLHELTKATGATLGARTWYSSTLGSLLHASPTPPGSQVSLSPWSYG